MEIPTIHVEDTSAQSNDGNNWDILRKINQLLDGSLDLNALSGISLPPEHVKVAMNALSTIHGQQGQQQNGLQSCTDMSQSDNYQSSQNRDTATGWQPFNTSSSQVNSSQQSCQQQSTISSQQTSSANSVVSNSPLTASSDPFIPGAISNRTLEQLTESMTMRPYRAIRAEHKSYPTDQGGYSTQNQSQHSQYSNGSNNIYLNNNNSQSYCSNTSSSTNPYQTGNNLYSNSNTYSTSNPYSSASNLYSSAGNLYSSAGNLYSSTSNPYFSTVGGANSNQYSVLNAQYNMALNNLSAQLGMVSAGQYSFNMGQYSNANQSYQQGGVGVIGDKPTGPLSPLLGAEKYTSIGRSPSPADSDSSGFSSMSGGSDGSDTALVDLMSTLNLSQQPVPQQTYPATTQGQGGQSFDIMKALGIPTEPIRQPQQQPLLNDFGLSADLFAGRPYGSCLNSLFSTSATDPYSIERAAKLYRNAASICEATCTWSGQLPPRIHKNPTYSCKVFLGGVPWDITEAGLQNAFKSFGPMKIEWPGKDGKHPRYQTKAGYVYVLFECEKSVKSLLQACTQDFSNGGEGYYYKISSRRMRSKEVQVIPWVLGDSNYVKQPSPRLDPCKTVFVGALHGMLNAEGLAHIMNDLFGNVVYAGIDTDKHKYPIGSGRVTFSSHKSYMKAVNAAFVEVKTPKFTKKVQIDPYLEDSLCNICNLQAGPFFCRDLACFRYYCRTCWQCYHLIEATRHHKPLMRNSKTNAVTTTTIV